MVGTDMSKETGLFLDVYNMGREQGAREAYRKVRQLVALTLATAALTGALSTVLIFAANSLWSGTGH